MYAYSTPRLSLPCKKSVLYEEFLRILLAELHAANVLVDEFADHGFKRLEQRSNIARFLIQLVLISFAIGNERRHGICTIFKKTFLATLPLTPRAWFVEGFL